MEEKTLTSTWPSEFSCEYNPTDSDVTTSISLKNTEDVPCKLEVTWGLKRFVSTATTRKKTLSDEEELSYSGNLREALSMAQTFSMLSTLLEKDSNPRTFIYNATGVINGYIPELKIDILVRIARDVIEKSKANGWWSELNTAIELAKSIYTTLKKIELIFEKDPEIPDRETLRFILTVSGNPEQILEEESKFKRQIRNTIRQQIREKITVTYYWK